MLLNVWDAWWLNMARLEAEEERATFLIAQAADSGWRMDRRELWSRWERLTAPKRPPPATKDLKGQMRRFADWMQYQWGGLASLIKRDE